ncbi:MAG: hypothetical protein HEQ21_07600 [Blastomonas sp.]|uniref:hypothetical protein n=1 Tax=Blastomonas sp. TaxID=1909299 RepID=UPI00258BF19B|nr:hypothetical protein [Blastomonas sp.]MCO5792668.1 hypothetical protein [Blastomonas sp.]
MSREDLILPVSRIPDVAEFLAALEVKPGGLGGKLFTEIYEQFFLWSTDLRVEYERYYCVEYPTLQRYLELAHEMELTPEQLEKQHILKVKSPGGMIDRAYDDNIFDVVIDCIKKLEGSNESQD